MGIVQHIRVECQRGAFYMPIYVLGSLNHDVVVRVQQLPAPGETVSGEDPLYFAGGKGANQAAAAAKCGGRTYMVGRVGRDPAGAFLRESLRSAGVKMVHVTEDRSRPTGMAHVYVRPDGENAIVVMAGANGQVGDTELAALRSHLTREDALILQLEVPLAVVAEAARIGREKGARVFFNPSPWQPLPAGLLKNVYTLVVNEGEAAAILGRGATDPPTELLALGVKEVVVTMGSRGVRYAVAGGAREMPAPRVEVVDTTGAGDTFLGALAVARSEGKVLPRAIRFAQSAAALKVGRMGAQAGQPRREEVERFMAEWQQETGLNSPPPA